MATPAPTAVLGGLRGRQQVLLVELGRLQAQLDELQHHKAQLQQALADTEHRIKHVEDAMAVENCVAFLAATKSTRR